jgi:hypothetical protein
MTVLASAALPGGHFRQAFTTLQADRQVTGYPVFKVVWVNDCAWSLPRDEAVRDVTEPRQVLKAVAKIAPWVPEGSI